MNFKDDEHAIIEYVAEARANDAGVPRKIWEQYEAIMAKREKRSVRMYAQPCGPETEAEHLAKIVEREAYLADVAERGRQARIRRDALAAQKEAKKAWVGKVRPFGQEV